MAPQKNPLLPYVKVEKTGKLTYRRQIPTELRPLLGGKAEIKRTLRTTSTDAGSASVLTAYSEVHSEVEALIQGARTRLEGLSTLMRVDSSVIRRNQERFSLSKREIAGIAGQVLRDIRNAVANQQLMSAEYTKALGALAMKVKTAGIAGTSEADFAVLARPTLNSLGIDPSPADMQAIGEALLAYIPVMEEDMAKLAQMDYSPPRIKEISPPLPKRQRSWRDLFDAWRRSTGGVLEVDGYGVSEKRHPPYLRAIAEFRQVITRSHPSEVTIVEARRYIHWLQDKSELSVRTQQERLTCLRNLLKIGIREGLVETNPFNGLLISTPAGAADTKGYRSFTKPELSKVMTMVHSETALHYRMVPWILLCTGCRLSEATQLRTTDIKQTEAGVWYFDWKHEPLHQYPMLLKTKSKNNRQTPLHPRLIDEGVLDIDRSHEGRLFPDAASQVAFSVMFQDRLKKLGIWEKKKTVLHSFRNTAKDLWRESGISQEFRSALTGHQSRDVGEASYGRGLQLMPDVMHKEITKLDLDWLK